MPRVTPSRDGGAGRATARKVLQVEADAIVSLAGRLDESFDAALDLLGACAGRVVVTGMGKAGIIARKIAATLASTGTPSLFLHPAEAIHGDLGVVREHDVVVALSNSGETDEICRLLPLIKKIGAGLIAMTGNPGSSLAQHSDVVLDIHVKEEACPLGLAPTASTTACLAMGDALAMALLELKGFRAEDYAFYHPGGALGRKLLMRVSDVMRKGDAVAVVHRDATLKELLFRVTKAKAGSASLVDDDGRLVGIFTDGDLRRHIGEDIAVLNRPARELMTEHPRTISPDRLAEEGLRILRSNRIDELPVVDENHKPIGVLDVQDLLRAGIV
jgi:arabinose-5-phosphate isomerase